MSGIMAADSSDIAGRIRAIEDRLEIYNLIASHPPAADTGSSAYTKSSYTDDGVIDLAAGKSAVGNERSRSSRRPPVTRQPLQAD